MKTLVISLTALGSAYVGLAEHRAEKWKKDLSGAVMETVASDVVAAPGLEVHEVKVRPFQCGIWPICETVVATYAHTGKHGDGANIVGPHLHILSYEYTASDPVIMVTQEIKQ